jgi:hypothetical protein
MEHGVEGSSINTIREYNISDEHRQAPENTQFDQDPRISSGNIAAPIGALSRFSCALTDDAVGHYNELLCASRPICAGR